MSEDLLPYYNRELDFIRRMGAEFADVHPKIAGRLKIAADSVEDPHVSRLIEAFALLNARIRHKLDDTFPEITDALLGVLYPHYLAPVPSMAIVGLEPDPDLASATVIERGAELETQPIDGEPVRFRTCYTTPVWPLKVVDASLAAHHSGAPVTRISERAPGTLRIRVKCLGPDTMISDLSPDRLRFFLHGESHLVYEIYELLLNDALEIAVTSGDDDSAPLVMGSENLVPVGFGRDEGMLPYSPRSFLGYRLLSEFFAFPEKFLFIDIEGLGQKTPDCDSGEMDIFIYLNRTSPDLERGIEAGTFLTGCTPVVNLFEQRAEPIQFTHKKAEYRVVPDARRPGAMEVYSVNEVAAISSEGDRSRFLPFYGMHHAKAEGERNRYWYASRRSVHPQDPGKEVYLSMVDMDFSPSSAPSSILEVHTTCLNRDLPNRLPFGGGDPRLHFREATGTIKKVVCLTRPTQTHRRDQQEHAIWGLISHLSLNHLSLVQEENSTEALREIVKLYDIVDSPQTQELIEGISAVSVRPAVGRVTTNGGGVCRGLEIEVVFDRARFSGSGLFIFASVLERFFALYCSINSFTKMVASEAGRGGEIRKWPPRAGEKVLL